MTHDEMAVAAHEEAEMLAHLRGPGNTTLLSTHTVDRVILFLRAVDAALSRPAALAAPPAEDARDYVAELRECHELLTSCVGGVDPDEHPGLVARINVVLGGCDVAGVCPAPVDPVPGSVDYWREVAARLGAEVKLMADALKGTTEQRDDALAKLTTAQAPPASDPPGLDVQGIAAIAWKCIKECKGYDMPPVMCPAHQAEAKALGRQSDPPGQEDGEDVRALLLATVDKFRDRHALSLANALREGATVLDEPTHHAEIAAAMNKAADVLAVRQSDPPGLVALVQHVSAELRHLPRFPLTAEGQQRKLDSLIVQMEKATTPLPASPQAETAKGDE